SPASHVRPAALLDSQRRVRGLLRFVHHEFDHPPNPVPERPWGRMTRKATRVTNDIRTLRFMKGEMTQAQLAEAVGVTRQTVIAIEQGRYSPTLEVAFRIARVFDVPLEQVFQYPE